MPRKSAIVAAETIIQNAIEETVNMAVETPAPKKKAQKAAPKSTPAATPEELGAETPAPTKPAAPVLTIGGEAFTLKADADAASVAAMLAKAEEAANAINRKDSDLLASYLIIGEIGSALAAQFASTKVYGQALAKAAPASQSLDPALRSNCKWLWEALNVSGHEASDILHVLGVNDIAAYRSGNPHVIRRDYKAAKDKAEALAKAAEAGMEGDEAELLAKVSDMTKAEKDAAKKAEAERLKKALKGFLNAALKADLELEAFTDDVENVVMSALFDGKSDTMDLLLSYTKSIREDAKKAAKAAKAEA